MKLIVISGILLSLISYIESAAAIGMNGPLPQSFYELEVKTIEKQKFELQCHNVSATVSAQGCLIRVTPSAVKLKFQIGKSVTDKNRDFLVYLDEKNCKTFDFKSKKLIVANLGCSAYKTVQCSERTPHKFQNEGELAERHVACAVSTLDKPVWVIHDPKRIYTIEELNH